MYETKQCRKCSETKAVQMFYVHRENKDGLDNWCKDCRNADNKQRHAAGHKQVASTAEGAEILKAHGIPCVPGYNAFFPGEDLVAYGNIIIEVKSAKIGPTGSYSFGFTKAQVQKERKGFVLLICNGERKRYFVVPANHAMFQMKGQRFCVKFGSTHKNAKWGSVLLMYENAFHLIGAEVVNSAKPVIGIDKVYYHKQGNKRRTTVLQPAQPALF